MKIPDYADRKFETMMTKSYPSWAVNIFNALPSSIKSQVYDKEQYKIEILKLCKLLPDMPYLIPYAENTMISQVKSKKFRY